MPKDLENPVAALAQMASAPFAQAMAMPPAVYTSQEFLDLERAHIFHKEWICVGRASAWTADQPVREFDVTGAAIRVTRAADGSLTAQGGDAPVRCETWLGWVYISLDPGIAPVSERLSALAGLIERYDMENYVETFFETHVWDTNWKILAENFMESYHLPVCHAGTVGAFTDLDRVECPEGAPHFNIHWFNKDAALAIGNAHPENTRLTGEERGISALVVIYPGHMITLTPGYFWYLSLQPEAPGRVRMWFGGGFDKHFTADPRHAEYDAMFRALLVDVNIEDRGCTEKVFRGVSSGMAVPGHLSHLERPIYDFANYLSGRMAGAGAAD